MSTITKQAVQAVADLKAGYTLGHADVAILNELARIALASLEAEPYGYVHKVAYEQAGSCGLSSDHEAYRDSSTHIAVYTAPPAPVSVPAAMEMDDDFDSSFEHGKAVGWNAYRAAMLQGAEPVTTAYKLPANTPCKDAPEHIWLQTAGVWPENGEFSELTWCSDNQHTDDTLYVRADVVAGNSPVIPDGWVLVPVEPTQAMMNAWLSEVANWRGHAAGYMAMIAAAPQQEVTQALAKGMERYGDAMQKLADSGD